MPNGEKKSIKESYDEGYSAAKKDFEAKKEKCLEFYTDGYKVGFRDGYLMALKDLSENMPPEAKKMIEEGAQPVWPIRW